MLVVGDSAFAGGWSSMEDSRRDSSVLAGCALSCASGCNAQATQADEKAVSKAIIFGRFLMAGFPEL
jgi:hypothetical protein